MDPHQQFTGEKVLEIIRINLYFTSKEEVGVVV